MAAGCKLTLNLAMLVVFSLVRFSVELESSQKSVFNQNSSHLALDDDPSTCAVTGYDMNAWLKVDLGEPKTVLGVTVIASSGAFQIRVGEASDPVGRGEGFTENALCYFSPTAINESMAHDLMCRHDITGRFVSLQIVDPVSTLRLRVCDLKIHLA